MDFKELKVCETPISDFKIFSVCSRECESEIVSFFNKNNLKLEVVENQEDNEHYIILDDSDFNVYRYSCFVQDGCIVVKGSYDTFKLACNEFIKKMSSVTEDITEKFGFKFELEHKKIPYKDKQDYINILKFANKDERVIIGQHMAGKIVPCETLEDYKQGTGKYPSCIDFDMRDLPKSTDSQISRTICELVDFASKGGMITTMVHWINPINPPSWAPFRGHLGYADTWYEVLTPGTKLNSIWQKELEIDARFLLALKNADVAVIYRPMHEANSNWFWFVAGQDNHVWLDSSCLVDMWKYIYHLYTDVYKLDNLVWMYSPNITNNDWPGLVECTYYYPGDEYCDAVGLDWYTNMEYEINGNGKNYEKLSKYGKPFAMCEFGANNLVRFSDKEKQKEVFSCRDVLDIIKRMSREGKKVAYWELYSGHFGAPSHLGYGEDLVNDPMMLSLDDMPQFINEALENSKD